MSLSSKVLLIPVSEIVLDSIKLCEYRQGILNMNLKIPLKP